MIPVLDPLVFLIMINNITPMQTNRYLQLFADNVSSYAYVIFSKNTYNMLIIKLTKLTTNVSYSI